MTLAVAVAIAGAIGAPARFALDSWLQRRSQTTVPVGTLAVNLIGALALGVITGLLDHHRLSPDVETVIGTGLLGAFTTFSTFTFETVRLAEEGAWRALATYVTVTMVGGLGVATLGLWATGALKSEAKRS